MAEKKDETIPQNPPPKVTLFKIVDGGVHIQGGLKEEEAKSMAHGYKLGLQQYAQWEQGVQRIGAMRECVKSVIFPRVKVLPE